MSGRGPDESTDRPPMLQPKPPGHGGWVRRLSPFLLAHKRSVYTAFGVALASQVVAAIEPLLMRQIIDKGYTHHQPITIYLVALVCTALAVAVVDLHPPLEGRVVQPLRAVRPAQRHLRAVAAPRLRRPRPAADRSARLARILRRRADPGSVAVHADHGRQPRHGRADADHHVPAVASAGAAHGHLPADPAGRVVASAGHGVPGHLGRAAACGRRGRRGRRGGQRRPGGQGVRSGGPRARPPGRRVRATSTRRAPGSCGCRPTTRRSCPPSRRSPRWPCSASAGGWPCRATSACGTFLAFTTYVALMVPPVRMLAGLFAVGQQARAGAERVLDILDTNPLITEKPDAVELPPVRGDVRFEDVRFGYTASQPVLDGFDLHVEPGEVVALVGTSGSGKSTVTALLPRFYDVGAGRITVDGIDVRDTTLDSLRHQVGVVFEEAFLFSESVRANIAYARPDASDDDVRAAAAAAGAARVHRRAARRLRHRGRRARPDPVGRAAPAHRPGAGDPDQPPHPRARRRHVGRRRGHRRGDPRHAPLDHGRPHDHPHRPPSLDAAPGRPHRRDRPRAGHGRGHP